MLSIHHLIHSLQQPKNVGTVIIRHSLSNLLKVTCLFVPELGFETQLGLKPKAHFMNYYILLTFIYHNVGYWFEVDILGLYLALEVK